MTTHNKYGKSYSVKDDLGNLSLEWMFYNPYTVITEFPRGVGNDECVTLAQDLLNMPSTEYWFEDFGTEVFGNPRIKKGAVIATFIDGVYKSLPHGNHVAIYVGQSRDGIVVIDQWRSKPPSRRQIQADNRKARSDNAFAFSVVRTSNIRRR